MTIFFLPPLPFVNQSKEFFLFRYHTPNVLAVLFFSRQDGEEIWLQIDDDFSETLEELFGRRSIEMVGLPGGLQEALEAGGHKVWDGGTDALEDLLLEAVVADAAIHDLKGDLPRKQLPHDQPPSPDVRAGVEVLVDHLRSSPSRRHLDAP